jgi:hypothetical protein
MHIMLGMKHLKIAFGSRSEASLQILYKLSLCLAVEESFGIISGGLNVA